MQLRLRNFYLHRDEDVHHVSGTGVVAMGTIFPNGWVALQWQGEDQTAVWFPYSDGIDRVRKIHGHHGKTRIVWLGEADGRG